MDPNRWQVISPSSFPWEQEALDYVRQHLGDWALAAWSNFEFFADDGSIHEVDLLVLTTLGLYLIEIKSWKGQLEGDTHTWVLTEGNRQVARDNPVPLANRKARILKGLLKNQPAMRASGVETPYVQALVFLSAAGQRVRLAEVLYDHVVVRDDHRREGGPWGVIEALDPRRGIPGARRGSPLLLPSARAVVKALQQAGIRPPVRARQVADYHLLELLGEGPGYQDWRAEHVSLKVARRIRQYPVARAASAEERERVVRAARNDFRMVEGTRHPGILRAEYFAEHEFGPALVFEYDPGAQRLDHFLATRGRHLDELQRLRLLRQVAEAVRYAHGRGLVHRALSPQSILVHEPEGPAPTLQIMNWQTGSRQNGLGTVHVEELVESVSTVYMAPEALSAPHLAAEPSDLFSLGALAFHLFSGRPPAASHLELVQLLREQQGLRLSAAVDGVHPDLDALVHLCTHPDVEQRLASAEDFLRELEAVERAVRAPALAEKHPLDAGPGDVLPGGFTVKGRLGQGGVSVAFLVEHEGEERVLKLARSPAENPRLREEAEVLGKLKFPHIVRLYQVVEMRGHLGLVLQRAGEQTLAQRLRQEGPLHLELLQRFGQDLLRTLEHLEKQGLVHRDIKPANLGVAPLGKHGRLGLLLFDFSLSRVPPENIRAGTPGYLDPFLPERRPPRWDLAAERYAAAVTLYEMATGVLPRWGDGRSDPCATEAQLVLEAERFDPSLRESLAAFFARALHRDPKQRFHNAEEMRRAWGEAFGSLDASTLTTVEVPEEERTRRLAEASLDTPVAALGLSAAASAALERLGATTVKGLLSLAGRDIRYMRGVGQQTRQQILKVTRELRRRFPDLDAAGGGTADSDEPSLDRLVEGVLAAGRRDRASRACLRAFLGLDPQGEGPEPLAEAGSSWPTLSEAAARAGQSLASMAALLPPLRLAWRRNRDLADLRGTMAEILAAQGGVMTAAELAEALLVARGSSLNDPARRQALALAVARAALEAEQASPPPRFSLRREEGRLLVSLSGELSDYALRLGQEADRLAAEDPLPTPRRVLVALGEVPRPQGAGPLPEGRLLRLAAAASRQAALSSRQELYPRGMPARRALLYSLGALMGARRLDPQDIRRRVAARYPEAEPLPPRPALDELLAEAGLKVAWDEKVQAYVRPHRDLLTSTSSQVERLSTTSGRIAFSPEVAEAREFEERLLYARRDRAFLVLMVAPPRQERAEQELVRRFGLTRLSLDRLILRAMRTTAEELEVRWDVVLGADAARGTQDWNRLLLLVRRALPRVEEALYQAGGPLLLVNPGLLARYGQMEFLEKLRDQCGRPGGLPGLWLLLPTDEQQEMPRLNGQALPLITRSQRARIPEAWLGNLHRGRAAEAGS
jgi:serine/threonine protein kinase